MRFAIIGILALLLLCCSGSKKYFKAAEKLEKQGLVDEAADYYLESLQRKPTNVDARIKLKEVGQKYVSSLASQFFRDYNTGQTEPSLATFEKLKDFTGKTSALNVQLDYPREYENDYQKAVESFCSRNYNQAIALLAEKKYHDALWYSGRVKKYNPHYRNLDNLEVVATCEPLYQSAISALENRNYAGALELLSAIRAKTEVYKDSRDLLELAKAEQTKSFMLFLPPPGKNRAEQDVESYLFNAFSETAQQKLTGVQVINNTPFQDPLTTDMSNGDNVDLIQAIRKATGADYFYVFDVSNPRETNNGPTRETARGFQEVTVRNGTVVTTRYEPFTYNVVKAQRTYSYDFRYKLINAYSNQIVASQTQTIKATDAVEYQEFHKAFNGNINSLYPYNPQQTPPLGQYNPRSWRALFSARNTLKPLEDLKSDAFKQNITLFSNSTSGMK